MAEPSAAIFLVGDELLAGEIQDRNGPFLGAELARNGFRVRQMAILPDDAEVIRDAVAAAIRHHDLVITCGGLGPTSDDLTAQSVAEAAGTTLEIDDDQWQRIRQMFQALRGVEPPPGNEKQAMRPPGSYRLGNANGTALGFAVVADQAIVAVLPGPPKENQPMFADELLPVLDERFGDRPQLRTRVFRVFGLAESAVGHRLQELEDALDRVKVAYQFHFPEILVKLRYPADAGDQADAAARELLDLLHPHVYGEGDRELPEVLGQTLLTLGQKVVTAESCTAGLVGKLLTDVGGSSAWYERGFITYTNQSKRELLRVPSEMLKAGGAVSEAVARAMLEGALERSAADVGLAITGIAGPGGGSPDKPVGTVCIAWGDRQRLDASTYQFHWDRTYNRLISAWTALNNVYRHVRGG